MPLTLLRCSLIAAALMVAACQRQPSEEQVATLDNQITGNQADPALTSALEDPILTDPALSQQSNRNAVRAPDAPVQAQYPPGARRERARTAAARREVEGIAHGEGSGCGAKFDYNKGWARRLPAAFPVFPGARITEAAGSDAGDCRMRVVTFTSDAPPQRVLGWYRQRAATAGYSVEQQRRERDLVLGGVNERDDGAYYLIVTPLGSGSDVALIANKGT